MTYRVVTKDFGGKDIGYSVLYEGTRTECRRYILGRWGHIPPFAVVTTRTSNFEKCF